MLSNVLTLSALIALTGANYYCGISRVHTLCRYSGVSGKCGKVYNTGVTESQKQQILDIHNRQRAQIASGTTIQPPASNMMELEWDDELANIAQRWTEQCQFDHDCSGCRKVSRFNVGQNLYVSFGYLRDRTDWRQPMKAWFDDEINLFPPSYVNPFKYIKKTGHYSQIGWAKTTKVGCGHTTHTSGRWIARIYICNYGSAGNVVGRQMYSIGRSCSRCPPSTSCSNNYPGLCTSNAYSRGSIPRIDVGPTRFIETPNSRVSNFTTFSTSPRNSFNNRNSFSNTNSFSNSNSFSTGGSSSFTSSFPSTTTFTQSFPSSSSSFSTSTNSFPSSFDSFDSFSSFSGSSSYSPSSSFSSTGFTTTNLGSSSGSSYLGQWSAWTST